MLKLIKLLLPIYRKDGVGIAAFQLTFANLFKSLVAIVSGILTAKWILPEQLGEFNMLSIFTSYIIISQIGIPSGLSRELPYLYGKKQDVEAEHLAATSKYFMLRLSQLVLMLSLIATVYFLYINKTNFAVGSIVIGFTSFQGLYVSKYLKVLYRSNAHFKKLAKITLINAYILAASIVFVYYYSFYGLCIRAILIAVVDAFITDRWKPLDVKGEWNKNDFVKLLKIGLPIYSVANIYGLWPTVQRTFILTQLGTTALGLYAIANIVQNLLNTLSSAAGSVVFPKMSSAYGAGASILELLKIPMKLVLVVLSINLFILLIGWNFLPDVIHTFLPNYTEGLDAAKWMLVVAVVNSLLIFSNLYMVVKKNQLRLISYLLGMLVWFLFILNSEVSDITDLVVYSKALLLGFSVIAITDFGMYIFLLRRNQRN
jgi:O-antigen/teichoic acid export membrane protein